MLSDVLVVVMWLKWVNKHLEEVTKNVFNWEKLLKTMILTTAPVNSVTSMEICIIQKQPPAMAHNCHSNNKKEHC